jgi:hypothetical protein
MAFGASLCGIGERAARTTGGPRAAAGARPENQEGKVGQIHLFILSYKLACYRYDGKSGTQTSRRRPGIQAPRPV